VCVFIDLIDLTAPIYTHIYMYIHSIYIYTHIHKHIHTLNI